MKGVIVPFPFSDLSNAKKRPAFVLLEAEKEDLILCQITSKPYDENSIKISAEDFKVGDLPIESYVRPFKVFTANRSIILKTVGKLNEVKTQEVLSKLIAKLTEFTQKTA
ncbi:type II toxin-antitoxin system PemK/MazF family toxin [Jiulongibacter sp. NS-SX5]|uniref:type II toxin-antitoxin system PemK/MazF family toxin n=1 Tax=Jiulongibacter sp. NS-SX5 TaxID=3463854 RepID=UPI0040584A8E